MVYPLANLLAQMVCQESEGYLAEDSHNLLVPKSGGEITFYLIIDFQET